MQAAPDPVIFPIVALLTELIQSLKPKLRRGLVLVEKCGFSSVNGVKFAILSRIVAILPGAIRRRHLRGNWQAAAKIRADFDEDGVENPVMFNNSFTGFLKLIHVSISISCGEWGGTLPLYCLRDPRCR